MCGIVGIYRYGKSGAPVSHDELRILRDAMANRGPDASGEWFSADRCVGLGHRRLAVIDPSDFGNQPMENEDSSIIISYNGEIYNYQEIRSTLLSRGHRFMTESDTEVLIRLYQEKGEAMLNDLRGMYAFLIWDKRNNKMIMARDPYGIKPLYYADDGNTIRIASQVKALLKSDRISKSLSPEGTLGYFLMGSVPDPHTIIRDIRSVPAGSVICIDPSGVSQPKFYFSILQIFENCFKERENYLLKRPVERAEEMIEEALVDTVRHHFISDVEVGLFLSSGIDSGLLAAFAAEAGISNLSTATLAFEEFKNTHDDEANLAAQVSAQYKTRHKTRIVSKSEFNEELPRLFQAMDQPSIDGINTYFISQTMARKKLKVCLNGLGADELFGGYPSFMRVPASAGFFSRIAKIPFVENTATAALKVATKSMPFLSPKYAGLARYGKTYAGAYFLQRGLFLPEEVKTFLNPDFLEEGRRNLDAHGFIGSLSTNGSDYARVAVLEATGYMRNQLLRDADWAGMAHSLEIRTPYVDVVFLKKIVNAYLTLEANKAKDEFLGKRILKRIAAKRLPRSLSKRKKTGFVLPYWAWLSVLTGQDNLQLSSPKRKKSEGQVMREWSKAVFNRYLDSLGIDAKVVWAN